MMKASQMKKEKYPFGKGKGGTKEGQQWDDTQKHKQACNKKTTYNLNLSLVTWSNWNKRWIRKLKKHQV